ncbi:enoyl-CoA hydratase/isomerase family protein [Ideonella sp. B508-1]|uniref:enoyl-CoA hydratase/isomerase family protein n=1 Tax=Ideonella sp. B508-1 TaxID=137716 RepID=UPI00034D0E76|nr:enoyl-CoA hydratase/isomerase family protein [Ideonella sp. B508-1]
MNTAPGDEPVLVDRDEDIVTLTLHNPTRKNAFSAAMRDRLAVLLAELDDDPQCRAIVLTGHGGEFSAGADLAGFGETSVRACRSRLKRGGMPLMRQMLAGSKPLVAAVEGHAFGAGLALASACDYLVAADGASFCCAFTRVGFIPDMALMHSLPHRVGMARAKQMIALAEVIPSERAERLGLVDERVKDGESLAAARGVARRFADGPPLAFEMVKSVFARGLEDMLRAELDLQPMLWLSEDHLEGKRAFAERRKPRFQGR